MTQADVIHRACSPELSRPCQQIPDISEELPGSLKTYLQQKRQQEYILLWQTINCTVTFRCNIRPLPDAISHFSEVVDLLAASSDLTP